MPKIRLSALATDIKGKSGGSVFSTNAGGTYFRNNPSGTGSKKPATSNRKQLFASLSQSWRNLSNAQQVAWSEAGILYPTTNAWGETRIPKGFELFMQLNGNLQAAGESLLLVPVAPRGLPAINSLEFTAPEQFQLIGQRGFCPDSNTSAELSGHGYLADFIDDDIIQQERFYCTRFSLNQSNDSIFLNPAVINLFLIDSNGVSLKAYFEKLSFSDYTFVTFYQDKDGYDVRQSSSAISAERLKDIHIGIQFSDVPNDPIGLYLNGVRQIMSVSETGSPIPQPNMVADLFIGYSDMSGAQVILQDFRVYMGTLSARNARLVSHGYVLTSELDFWPFSKIDDGTFENLCSAGRAITISEEVGTPSNFAAFLKPFTAISCPNVEITLSPIEEINFKIQVLTSDFVSAGKSSISVVKKTIGYFEALDVSELDIRTELENLLKFTLGGTTLFLSVRLLDVTSGQVGVLTDVLPANGTKPRFKAGAEISGKVN